MKERIAITGSNGTIGTILRNGLSGDFEIKGIDLPQTDATNYQELLKALEGNTAVVHLAWSNNEHLRNEIIDPSNAQMALNVYKGAREAKVKRVIIASSIHADSFYGEAPFLSTGHTPVPDSPYGADKIFIETLGRYFAKGGLEVVAIRFGGINPANIPPSVEKYPKEERAAWLSHNDCISLVRKVLEAEKVPGNFVAIYGVSDNRDRVHDVSNPFGWSPKERAEDFI